MHKFGLATMENNLLNFENQQTDIMNRDFQGECLIMKTRAAVLYEMEASQPYKESKPLKLRLRVRRSS